MKRLTLEILDQELAVVRLARHEPVPPWFEWGARPISSLTQTDDETSILCPAELVPPDAQAERGWRAIRVRGPLEFSLTGILHSILAPLSAAEVSVFALSTYDTDYVLVRHLDLPRALAALRPDFEVVDCNGP